MISKWQVNCLVKQREKCNTEKKAGTLDKQLGIVKAAIIKVNEKVILIKVIDKQINAFKKYRQSLDAIMTSKDFLCE